MIDDDDDPDDGPEYLSQMGLISAILGYLARGGTPHLFNRQTNAIIEAANDIMAALDWKEVPAADGMGLAAWACGPVVFEKYLRESGMAGQEYADQIAVRFTYTNWRGEVAERHVIPLQLDFKATDWHPEPQWVIHAKDLDKGGELRTFAVKDITNWRPSGGR
jgi:hypothetical protein